MDMTLDIFNGLCFGIEYIGKDADDDIEESVIVIDFACIRCIIWLGDIE